MMFEALSAAVQKREEARQRTLAERRAEQEKKQMLEIAREEVADTRSKWQQQAAQEKQEFVADLRRRAAAAIQDIARQALRDLADAGLEEQLVDSFLQRLKSLDKDARKALAEVLQYIRELSAEYGLPVANVFHAGDGNLHPLIFFDSRDANQLKRVKKAGWEIMEACVELGGTISGEHGVGLEKIEAMRLVFSELDFVAQRGLQQAFDPDRLLNPGKVIPLSPPEQSIQEARAQSQFTSPDALSAVDKEISEAIQSAAAGAAYLEPPGWAQTNSSG